jgi:hypothetical protein
MKKYTMLFTFLCVLNGAVSLFAMREETKSPDLSYSIMPRTSAGNTADTSGYFMITSWAKMVGDEKMTQDYSKELVAGLVEIVEALIVYELKADEIKNRIIQNILPKISATYAHWLFSNAATLAQKQVNGGAYKILKEISDEMLVVTQAFKEKFQVNAGIEEAIEKGDEHAFVQLLERSNIPAALIKKTLKIFGSGCHESVGNCDYDAKGKAI